MATAPRAPRPLRSGLSLAAVVAGTLALGTASGSARAADPHGFGVDTFEPLPVQGRAILGLSTARLLGSGDVAVGLFGHYQDSPLTTVTTDGSDRVVSRLVDSRWTAELLLAVGILERFEVGLAMPFVLSQSGDDLGPIGRPGEHVDGFSLGDLRLIPKVRIVGGGGGTKAGGFGLHFALPLILPTGSEEQLTSDGGFRVRPTLGAEYAIGRHGGIVAASLAYDLRPETKLTGYTSDDQLRWSLGGRVPILVDRLAAVATLQGAVGLADQPLTDSSASSVELLGGVEVKAGGLVVSAGAGGALVRGVGSSGFRAFLAVGWQSDEPGAPEIPPDKDGDGILDKQDKCKDFAEDKDGFQDEDGCPDPDNDGDGVNDEADQCPTEREDFKGPEDGCATHDQDGDGVLDDVDKCPALPEDKDGEEDEDGCPDLDTDNDGIDPDKCRNEPEDKDGFQDEDGCPDPDNDQDGILDGADKCPERPETKNGFQDDDGCPDTTEKKVVITGTGIEIKESIFFPHSSDKIEKRSFAILDAVTRVLAANPFVTKLSIEGHTDSEGPEDANIDLSSRRAAAVRQYLVDHGIAPERLTSTGFGEGRPLKPNTTPAGCAANRRVEFRIIEVGGKPVPPPDGP